MDDLSIKTQAVIAAAEQLKVINNQINDEFATVQKAIDCLDKSWDGKASEATISKFNEFKSTMISNRLNVLDNFVSFLYQQVGEGYIQTEEVNTSLADEFK